MKQVKADADAVIVSTALSLAASGKLVVSVGIHTDLLAMLMTLATTNMNRYMLSCNNPTTLQSSRHSRKLCGTSKFIMVLHALTGCHIMSALYLQGKREVFSLVHNNNEFDSHSTLVDADSTHQQIQSFLLKLYGASSCASQKEFRYMPTTKQSAECYYPYPSSWQLCLQVLQPNNIPAEHISLFRNGW